MAKLILKNIKSVYPTVGYTVEGKNGTPEGRLIYAKILNNVYRIV